MHRLERLTAHTRRKEVQETDMALFGELPPECDRDALRVIAGELIRRWEYDDGRPGSMPGVQFVEDRRQALRAADCALAKME